MPDAFAVNDKVRLGPARGSWTGFIAGLRPGPGGPPSYLVRSIRPTDPDEGIAIVQEAEIDTVLGAPAFTVGQTVSLMFRSGTITADHADGTFSVQVTRDINRNLTVSTVHRVPLWLIGINNP